jgi:hypothetical protein
VAAELATSQRRSQAARDSRARGVLAEVPGDAGLLDSGDAWPASGEAVGFEAARHRRRISCTEGEEELAGRSGIRIMASAWTK